MIQSTFSDWPLFPLGVLKKFAEKKSNSIGCELSSREDALAQPERQRSPQVGHSRPEMETLGELLPAKKSSFEITSVEEHRRHDVDKRSHAPRPTSLHPHTATIEEDRTNHKTTVYMVKINSFVRGRWSCVDSRNPEANVEDYVNSGHSLDFIDQETGDQWRFSDIAHPETGHHHLADPPAIVLPIAPASTTSEVQEGPDVPPVPGEPPDRRKTALVGNRFIVRTILNVTPKPQSPPTTITQTAPDAKHSPPPVSGVPGDHFGMGGGGSAFQPPLTSAASGSAGSTSDATLEPSRAGSEHSDAAAFAAAIAVTAPAAKAPHATIWSLSATPTFDVSALPCVFDVAQRSGNIKFDPTSPSPPAEPRPHRHSPPRSIDQGKAFGSSPAAQDGGRDLISEQPSPQPLHELLAYHSLSHSLQKMSQVHNTTLQTLTTQLAILNEHVVELNNVICELKRDNDALRLEGTRLRHLHATDGGRSARRLAPLRPQELVKSEDDDSVGLLLEVVPGKRRLIDLAKLLTPEEMDYVSHMRK